MGLKEKKLLSTAIRSTGSARTLLSTTRTSLPSSAPITSHTTNTSFFSPSESGRCLSFQPWNTLKKKWENQNDITNKEDLKDTQKVRSSKVIIDAADLTPEYQKIQRRFRDLMNHIVLISFSSPACAATFLHLTQQQLWDSKFAMAILAAGAGGLIHQSVKARRLNTYTYLSTLTSDTSLSPSEKINKQIEEIMAGLDPDFKLSYFGLVVSGPKGDINNPSKVRDKALERVLAINRWVVPLCAMEDKEKKLTQEAFDRWFDRITLPLHICKILLILASDPKKKNPKNDQAFAAAIHKISNFITGASLGASRHEFMKTIIDCDPEEAVQLLIDHNILDKGAMSHLKHWVKDKDYIGVRIGRDGEPVLDSGRGFFSFLSFLSRGGPCPKQLILRKNKDNPEEQNQYLLEESDEKRTYRSSP